MRLAFLLFLTTLGIHLIGQTVPVERTTKAWSKSGLELDEFQFPIIKLNIETFGGIADDGLSDDTALSLAFDSLDGTLGMILFGVGEYNFSSNINLPDSTLLKGISSDSTTFRSDLGGSGDLIRLYGTINNTKHFLTEEMCKDTNVFIASTSSLSVGNMIRLSFDDSDLVTSSWADESVGLIGIVDSIKGDTVFLDRKSRIHFAMAKTPFYKIITPRVNSGIECISLIRDDATSGQTDNISLRYAYNCWIRGIESDKCNFSHLEINSSCNIHVSESYFHHAFGYGGGGKAYGIAIQFTSGECLIENNIFEHLRHSVLLQAGPNGNVISYNYSTDPFWSQFPLPSNSAGDLVLHGNYPFYNLFEGNICQNIVIDDSHGINGTHNLFFRNRAELYGIFMNNSPASDSQSFVGNEIPNTGLFLGLYSLEGIGHFEHGNNDAGVTRPPGTSMLPDTSYYLDSLPLSLVSYTEWPAIGYPNASEENSLPAKDRFDDGELVICPSIPCNNYLIVSGVLPDSIYSAKQYIRTLGNTSPDTNSTFIARDSIILNTGYSVPLGIQFISEIGPCEGFRF